MRARMGQLVRYGGTAGVAALVDVGGFWALDRAGWPLAAAAAASFLIATVVNYGLSARLVFGARLSLRGYGRFLLAAAVGFMLNVGVTVAAARVLGLPPVAAKVVGVALAFFANFALNAAFVFRRPPSGQSDAGPGS